MKIFKQKNVGNAGVKEKIKKDRFNCDIGIRKKKKIRFKFY